MTFRTLALTAILSGSTALGAMAADQIQDAGNSYEDAAKASGNYVYDRDTYQVEGQTFTNVGGEIRNENAAIVDEDKDTQMSQTEATSAENIVAAAEQGVIVTSSDDLEIGTVAYTQEANNSYRVFVNISPEANIPAQMIGFDVSGLEVKTTGSGLEFANTLEKLRMDVAERVAEM